MAKKLAYPIWSKDGRILYLPAWKGGQEGYENLDFPDIRDTNIVQLYPVGTKLVDGERVFYYAKASAVGVTKTDYGVKNGYPQHVAYATIAAAAVAGAKEIVLDVGASDGVAGNGEIAANELAGGFVVVFNHDDDAFTCRILENTAVAAGGDEMTLTLQDEIPVALAAGDVDHGECMAHWALGCEWNEKTEEPVVGMSHAKVTADYWFWLQTWGPVWIAPRTGPCEAAYHHQAVFKHTGEVEGHNYDDAELTKQQHAGFGLAHAYGGGMGAPFIMLQICP